MKLLLLFFLLKRSKRHGEYYLCGGVFYWSCTCGNEWMLLAREYVSLHTKPFNEKIKNLHLIKPKNTGRTTYEKQVLLSNFCMLLFKVFNVEIQWLTTSEAIVFPLSALTLKTSDFPYPCHSSGLLNIFINFSFYEHPHEHFYRLKSLIEHTPESAHTQQTAEKERGLFRKIGLSKYPFK